MEEKYSFKIILLGDSNVGKSTFVNTFKNDGINDDTFKIMPPTIGVDFNTKLFKKDNKFIKLFLWDTSGQEKFKTLTAAYFRDVDCIIFMYDIKNNESRNNIRDWISYADSKLIDQQDNNYECIIVANKYDLLNENERESIIEDCKEFTNSLKKDFFVCSSLKKIKDFDVMFIFIKIIDKLLQNKKPRNVIKKVRNEIIMPSEKNINNTEYQCRC